MTVATRFAALGLILATATAFSRPYTLDGIVLEVDHAARRITIAHRPVPNVMPAMTMTFAAATVEGLTAGVRVQFIVDPKERPLMARMLRCIPADTGGIPKPPESLKPGAIFPDFSLTDHDGRTIQLSNLRGHVAVLQFVYTRCPLADVCPRLAANFAFLQKRFLSSKPSGLVLLSITIDPDHDTQEVLRRYARSWGAGGGWRFLTGPLQVIGPVAAAAGLVFWPDEGAIGHTSSTVIVTRNGRVGATLEGSQFRPDQLASLVVHFLEQGK